MTAPHRARAALLLAVTLAAGACDGVLVEPPGAACTAVGERCQLPGGPLGVCEQAPCAPAATPPCLRCTAQH